MVCRLPIFWQKQGSKLFLADKNHSTINFLRNGTSPFLEPELNTLLKKHAKNMVILQFQITLKKPLQKVMHIPLMNLSMKAIK
jgi:UDP-glucose 6-dehydrogenase